MPRYLVECSDGNAWIGEARDADDAQERAIDTWESGPVVFGEIETIRRLETLGLGSDC